jgi:predicted DNA-binding transcriptional regulator AlpA
LRQPARQVVFIPCRINAPQGASRHVNQSGPFGLTARNGYVRQSQLIPAIFPFSSATLWRKVKAGTFPKPVKLGPRITAWRVEDIHAFIAHIGQ